MSLQLFTATIWIYFQALISYTTHIVQLSLLPAVAFQDRKLLTKLQICLCKFISILIQTSGNLARNYQILLRLYTTRGRTSSLNKKHFQLISFVIIHLISFVIIHFL